MGRQEMTASKALIDQNNSSKQEKLQTEKC